MDADARWALLLNQFDNNFAYARVGRSEYDISENIDIFRVKYIGGIDISTPISIFSELINRDIVLSATIFIV